MKRRNEKGSEDRILNSEYPMPEVRVNGHGNIFCDPRLKSGALNLDSPSFRTESLLDSGS